MTQAGTTILKLPGTLPSKRAREGGNIMLKPQDGKPVEFLLSEFERHTNTLDEVLAENAEITVSNFSHSAVVGLQCAVMRGCLPTTHAFVVLQLASFLGMQNMVVTILSAWRLADFTGLDLRNVLPKTVEELREPELLGRSLAGPSGDFAGLQPWFIWQVALSKSEAGNFECAMQMLCFLLRHSAKWAHIVLPYFGDHITLDKLSCIMFVYNIPDLSLLRRAVPGRRGSASDARVKLYNAFQRKEPSYRKAIHKNWYSICFVKDAGLQWQYGSSDDAIFTAEAVQDQRTSFKYQSESVLLSRWHDDFGSSISPATALTQAMLEEAWLKAPVTVRSPV